MEAALEELRSDLKVCQALETALRGRPAELVRSRSKGVRKPPPSPVQPGLSSVEVQERVEKCLETCKESRKRHREKADPPDDLSDEALSQYTRFTDETALDVYKQFLHYVPRLVNVVTLAEAIPMPGSGISLPLDLKHIASRCVGSYFAPKRFAAVQLAFATPRCRVLVFHTGRLVGTGTSSASAARLAIARAQRQLADQAGVHVHVRNFQVGAVSLQATLNCDAFATEHSAESHFDRSSFVGLAWRPPREDICCEIYSTGRANLPGSIAERQLLGSFSRMLPELLRFSSASHLLAKIPEEQQAHHRVARPTQGAVASGGAADNAGGAGTSAAGASSSAHSTAAAAPVHVGRARKHLAALDARTKPAPALVQPKKPVSIWDGWGDAEPAEALDGADLGLEASGALAGSDGELDLDALGL